MEDKITAILKDEFLSADIADQDLNANLGNVVKIEVKDYNRLNNKPQINGVTLQGNKSALELGLVPTDLSELEAVEQPIKSVRQTADMFVDNGGNPSKIALQQVKDMATKVVYADELGNVDFEKLDIDDYVILGDEIYRVVDAQNNIKQLLPETSAEHVTFADKKGEYDSTNVEDALAEVMDIAKTGGVTGVKGDAETEYRKGNVSISKDNIGLDQVDNTADLDKPISNAQKTVNAGFENNFKQLDSDIDTLGKGLNERIDATNSNLTALRESTESALSNQQESINDIDSTLNSHIANQSNPHSVTKAQVGLDKVDNTADVDKIVKEAGKATNDGAGNNIVDTYASKQYVQEGLAGKSRSIAFADYQAFVTAVNGYGNTTLKVSDNVFVKTLGVPDMWVTAVNSEKAVYTYTNDQAIVNALNTTNGLTVGYYTFSQLETTKVDLTSYQQKTDSGLSTTNKTVVGAINEVKGTADNALSKANTNATEISQIKDGTTKVKKAEHSDTTDNATNVTTNINGKAISSIFETNGTTAKEATRAGKATSADNATRADSASKVANSLTFSGQNAQGTESTIGFDGSQAQEVAFNGDDFVATKGNAFEVSLAPSGATAGTYNNVTIDGKGRVTGGENKDYATVAQVNAKYTKPESGIPKNDLAEDVKTSLGKADTAVQSDALSVYAKKPDCEAISLANADWEMSGGYNIVPKKPLVDGYEGVLCFNLEVIPHPLEINWDNATAWGDIQNVVGVRLFSFTYEGETQDICFVEFPAGTEINNTVLTFSAYAVWLGTIIPLWADTEFWKAYGDGGSGGAISANDTGWVKNDGLPVYGNYMRYIVAVSITNIANQDIWGSYITGEQLWTKKPTSEFSWSEIYPYHYSATKTLSSIPVTGSEVALLCDSVAEEDIRLCASCGVTIGKVDGTNITFYAMDKPYKNLSLFVEYAKQE